MRTGRPPTSRRSSSPTRPSGRLVAIVPLMHRHEVEPTDAETHTTMRHGNVGQLTAVAPTRQGHLLRRLVPRRLRDRPRGARRPAGGRRGRRRVPRGEGRAGRPASRSVGRRRPSPPPVRRSGRRRARGRVRPPRDRRGLDAQRRARGRLPGRPPAGGHRLRRLPRDARQEGSPRDPAQDPAGGGASARSG